MRNIPKEENWVYTINQHWVTGTYIDERIYRSDFSTDEEFHSYIQKIEEAKTAAIHNIPMPKWTEEAQPEIPPHPLKERRTKVLKMAKSGTFFESEIAKAIDESVEIVKQDKRWLRKHGYLSKKK